MGNDKTRGSLNPNLKHPESCLQCRVPPNALVPPLLSGWGGWVPIPEVSAHDPPSPFCVQVKHMWSRKATLLWKRMS